MSKNVLQFIGSFHQGGSERQTVQLVKLLHADDTFNVFTATMNREGVLLNELEEIGLTEIPEFSLTSFFELNFLNQIRRCAEFLTENKIEIVHTHDFYTNVFGILAARYARIPVKIASKRETGGMRSNNQDRLEKFIFKLADAVTVNAEAVKDYLTERQIPAEKIEITYNGLDLERLKPNETDRKKICEILNLPPDDNIRFITMVANLRHEVKNQPMLLRAAKRLKEKFPETHFVFAGEGERKSLLEKMAKNLEIAGKTHFINRCRIVPELLSISEICVLTSTAEGFSNSILEYMALSKPVVATNVGGASEAVIEGETGFLIESNDDKALAGRLSELLENPEKAVEMGKAGRKRVEEKFSTEIRLKNIISLYQNLLER